MAVDPLTAKILAKVAVQAATDSESRKRILFMILAPVLGLLLLIAFILYLIIIYDCGVMQTPTSIFRDADHRLLCGSVLPYEIPVFHKALSECGSLEVRPVAICVPQEIQEYCMELFWENVQIAAASHDLFAKRVNGQIYRPLVEKYIAGEKRL